MKIVGKVLAACAVVLGLGLAAGAVAADNNLPSTKLGGTVSAADALKQDAVCTRCHDENGAKPNVLSIYQTKHGVHGDGRTPTCQACHGESLNHLKGDTSGTGRPAVDISYSKGTYPLSSEQDRAKECIACHKGTARTHWEGSQHQVNGVACNDCHKLHQPTDKVRVKQTQREVCFTCHKDQQADAAKISTHPLDAGKIACSDCHNPHGSAGPKLMKKNTINQTCWTCHAEKRGPFLWEHQPVNESCANCHTPHGSNIAPLLKDRPPFLCDDCHDGPHNSQAPYGKGAAGPQGGQIGAAGFTANSSASGRACMNCHVMVHGSNSPAGAYLHR